MLRELAKRTLGDLFALILGELLGEHVKTLSRRDVKMVILSMIIAYIIMDTLA